LRCNVKNRLFDDRALAVLLDPRRWKMVSSLFQPNIAPLRKTRHAAWSRQHTHAHPNQEILFALRGSAPYGHLGRIYACAPGTVIVFDSNEPHDSNYPPRPTAALHLWIHLVEDRIFSNTISCLPSRGMASEPKCSFSQHDLGVDVRRVLESCRGGGVAAEALRLRWDGAFQALIGRIVEEGCRQPASPSRGSVQVQTIKAIQRHLLQTGGCGAKLENLARIAGYSKFHFLRLFEKHAGRPVHKYVDWCRIQKTLQFRREGRALKEIGAALGFSCQAAFSRWYRKHCREGA
jgi:AraC-like DNA-binding protein